MYAKTAKRWLKAEMHAHCNLDPVDYRLCRHAPEQLIDRAAQLGYQVLSFTCHNRDIWNEELADYALRLGIILIPGMEVSVEGKRHVLVYNFHTGSENLNTLEKIKRYSRPDTLVIAPHPFFPGGTSLDRLLEQNLDVFDAFEYSGFEIRGVNFNRRVVELAEKTGKPLVACADVHHLYQLGRTFTWIYAEPNPHSILGAVKHGSVRIEKSLLSWSEAAGWWATALWRFVFPVNSRPFWKTPRKLSPARD